MTRDWRDLAACTREDPGLFTATDPRTIRIARTICQIGCPVMLTCRAAGAGEPAGVWGGQDADERAAWARAQAGQDACGELPGTVPGYARHIRARQAPCPECQTARSIYIAELPRAVARRGDRARARAAIEDIEARRRQVRVLAVEQGMTDARIADALGVSEKTILRDRQAAGIPTAHPEKARRRQEVAA